MRLGLTLAAGALLGGCTALPPSERGMTRDISGRSVAAEVSGGFVTFSGEGLTCGGNYDPLTAPASAAAPIECVDGRRGVATFNRRVDDRVGSGMLRLEDGTELRFVFRTPPQNAVGWLDPAPASGGPYRGGFLPAR